MNTQVDLDRKNSDLKRGRAAAADVALRPAVDIFETAEGITLQADMPGVSRERLTVQVDGNTLSLEGRIGIGLQEHMEPLYADVRSTLYRCSFVLSNELETQKIEAQLKDGLLTLRIPKRAELQSRRIDVKVA